METIIITITAITTTIGVVCLVIGIIPDKNEETPVTRHESHNHETYQSAR